MQVHARWTVMIIILVLIGGIACGSAQPTLGNIAPAGAAGASVETSPTSAATTVAMPWTPDAALTTVQRPPALPAESRLQTEQDAEGSAIRWVENILQAQQPRSLSTELMTVQDALIVQQAIAGTSMRVFDRATLATPVWVVRLEGSSFHLYNCPSCPTGASALLTIRARDESLYSIAVGSPPVAGQQTATMTQVFPALPRNVTPSDGSSTIATESIVQEIIDQVRQRGAIKSGDAEVLLSAPATFASLTSVGLFSGDYSPTCARPLQLVILRGDFDLEGALPGMRSATPARYLGLIVDLAYGPPGDIMGWMGSLDGAQFKEALNDPTLPDRPSPPLNAGTPNPPPPAPVNRMDPPCEDIYVRGG